MISKEEDANWITINGTHVQVDSAGNIVTGPDSLKALPPMQQGPGDTRQGTALNGDKYAYYPTALGGMERGEPMTHEEADGRSANPGYRKGTGTASNCQSCVVAYEARLRGYDVEAMSYTGNDTAEMLSLNTRSAWVDPETGDLPDFEPVERGKVYDRSSFGQYLESTVKTGARYTLEFKWKNARGGHIISVDRDEDGKLRLYDPQSGKDYSKDYARDELLGRMRYEESWGASPPNLLRVDTLSFREDVVNNVVKEERAGWQRKTPAAEPEDEEDWVPF